MQPGAISQGELLIPQGGASPNPPVLAASIRKGLVLAKADSIRTFSAIRHFPLEGGVRGVAPSGRISGAGL